MESKYFFKEKGQEDNWAGLYMLSHGRDGFGPPTWSGKHFVNLGAGYVVIHSTILKVDTAQEVEEGGWGER